MRVCRKWYHMIRTRNFIYAHLQRSTPGLLMQSVLHSWDPFFMATVKGRVEISKHHYEFANLCVSSCNGLTLENYDGSRFCIANPATNQHFYPPRFPTSSTQDLHCSAIAYTAASMDRSIKWFALAASMEYKVVCPCVDKTSKLRGCAILTVGVDNSWRNIHAEHLSLAIKRLFLRNPWTYDWFLHWTTQIRTHMFTLNVETEIMTETRVPLGCNGNELMYYLSSGRSLTVLVECSGFSWDVWELKKPENGEWAKMAHIDLESRKCKFEELVTKSFCDIDLES